MIDLAADAKAYHLDQEKVAAEKKLRELLTKESIEAYHDIIVEECAQLCDNHFGGSLFATAIRAKRKNHEPR